jgi:hypothetical protein
MEQKDYLLREIEKIGIVLRMILNKIAGMNEVSADLNSEQQFEAARGMLLLESGFDLEKIISLEKTETGNYISDFKGLSAANIEVLGDILNEIGMNANPEASKEYLERALMLYELCNSTGKTFSFEREGKISQVKSRLFQQAKETDS